MCEHPEGDLLLLARLIEAEAKAEVFQGKVAVGAVVLNRVKHEEFPENIEDVIFQEGQFQCISNGSFAKIAEVGEKSILAAKLASEGEDPSSGALFFFNPAKTRGSWFWQREITAKIGAHVFAK